MGLTGDLAGMSMAAEVVLASNAFDAVLGTSVAGAGVSIEATGNVEPTLSAASYVAMICTSAMGFDLGLTADGSSLGYVGCNGRPEVVWHRRLMAISSTNLGVEYSADLAEGLSLDASCHTPVRPAT